MLLIWDSWFGATLFDVKYSAGESGVFAPVAGSQGLSGNSASVHCDVLSTDWISGQLMVVGSNEAGTFSFPYSPVQLTQPMSALATGYLKASNTGAGDNFGSSVALSRDGSTLVVGAYLEQSNAWGVDGDESDNSLTNAGAVYVFVRSADSWSQQAYLKASNTGSDDYFGLSVALSADGNTLAVGASGERSNAIGVDGDESNNSLNNAGAVYIFVRNGSMWSQQAYVKASNTGNNDYFGGSVALSHDGNTLAVGADGEYSSATGVYGDENDNSMALAGAVYVFERSSSTWTQRAYVKASNSGDGDHFGCSVALSQDGKTLAVGARTEESNATGVNGDENNDGALYAGAAYVFTNVAGLWSQQAYVKASNTDANDRFGRKVVLSADGNTLVVNSVNDGSNATGINGDDSDNSFVGAGAVHLYKRSGSVWSHQTFFKASNTRATQSFGTSLSLSQDGNKLVVGAWGESGSAIGVNGDETDTGKNDSGAAYLFEFNNGVWSQKAYVKSPNTGTNDSFGQSVALSGDGTVLAIGANLEDSSATGIGGDSSDNGAVDSGAVFLY